MQLMAEAGLENSSTNNHQPYVGLGWIGGAVAPLKPIDTSLKIPHMGWNEVHCRQAHPVLDGMDGKTLYFVHSYAFEPSDSRDCVATCSYDQDFCAIIARDNMLGTQFHPEKSQTNGLALIENFLRWRP